MADTLRAKAASGIIAVTLKCSKRNQEPSGCSTDKHGFCSLNHGISEVAKAIGMHWFTALLQTSKMCLCPGHEHMKRKGQDSKPRRQMERYAVAFPSQCYQYLDSRCWRYQHSAPEIPAHHHSFSKKDNQVFQSQSRCEQTIVLRKTFHQQDQLFRVMNARRNPAFSIFKKYTY